MHLQNTQEWLEFIALAHTQTLLDPLMMHRSCGLTGSLSWWTLLIHFLFLDVLLFVDLLPISSWIYFIDKHVYIYRKKKLKVNMSHYKIDKIAKYQYTNSDMKLVYKWNLLLQLVRFLECVDLSWRCTRCPMERKC